MANDIVFGRKLCPRGFGKSERDCKPQELGRNRQQEEPSERQPFERDQSDRRRHGQRELKNGRNATLIFEKFGRTPLLIQALEKKGIVVAAEECERQTFKYSADDQERKRTRERIAGDRRGARHLTDGKRELASKEIGKNACRDFKDGRGDLRDREHADAQ